MTTNLRCTIRGGEIQTLAIEGECESLIASLEAAEMKQESFASQWANVRSTEDDLRDELHEVRRDAELRIGYLRRNAALARQALLSATVASAVGWIAFAATLLLWWRS